MTYNNVANVAFADIDRDGDLDLISSSSRRSYLHWNTGSASIFDPVASWEYPRPGTSGAAFGDMVVGDVNHDGFVDVVVGRTQDRYIALIINRAGNLDQTSLWQTRDPQYAVALADLNQDGYLDLLCGADDGGAHVYYLNNGDDTVFPAAPDWVSATSTHTPRIAVGDLDGDGDVDLVCGNVAAANHLFINRGPGVARDNLFSTEPDHIYTHSRTTDVVLGDIDGDGDLDLVEAQDRTVSVYLNRYDEGPDWVQSIFDTTAVWATTITLSLFTDVVLGDIDRDGDLDLFVGTDNTLESLFIPNTGAAPWFATTGVALPDSAWRTHEIGLGDVDGDGDLDLIMANHLLEGGVRLYLNRTTNMSANGDQPMLFPLATYGLAAGDVDNDGDPDLVAANEGLCDLYYADPLATPCFPPVGVNVTQDYGASTRAVALADLDGDGYPELICGNSGEADYVFKNNNGTIDRRPVWASDIRGSTTSLEVGDVNGDGKVDLLIGAAGSRNSVYLNVNGMFGDGPAWEGPDEEATQAVALADFDLDGDLDAVFGNRDQGNTIHLNLGTTLAEGPTWASQGAWSTTSVAVGDVDGDGYPDLLCGNDGQANNLYLNNGGALALGFNPRPYWWTAASDSTRAVALVDVDGDGDLDILCGNADTGTACYLNEGGEFSVDGRATWRTEDVMDTQAIVLADFDLDGDLDLVCGNRYQVNTVHYGLAQPLLRWHLTQPAHHLTNNPTLMTELRVTGAGLSRYRLTLTLGDAESDPVGLALRYRYADSPVWHPVVLDPPVPSLATSPAGEPYQFDWDVSRLEFDRRDVVLSVGTIPNPQTYSEIRQTSSAQFIMGPLDIRRAELTTEPVMSFSRVTVGDTVWSPLAITNRGNENLDVTMIELPSGEMRLARGAPFVVAPGMTVIDTLFLEPRESFVVEGEVTIRSNDPRAPTWSIAVETIIDSLTIETRPLLEGDTAPLGDALTIQVIPDENVHVERGALYYRRAGHPGVFTAVELTPSGRSFIGVIHGRDVTEGGLEYFIEVENSGVFATDPRDTSGGKFHLVLVADPSAIGVIARPSSGNEYLADRSVNIDVVLPEGTEYVDGWLRYRAGGAAFYDSTALTLSSDVLVGSIPDSLVGARGVEYWVEVHTRTQTLTDPPTAAALNPRRIQVTVPDFAEAETHPGGQYRMVSVPLQFKDDFTGTLEALLFDQPEFGSYDPVRWRSFRWLPTELRYAELAEEGQAATFRPEPGRAFWLACSRNSRITTTPITATSTPTDGPKQLELAPGWNQVGTPFAFPVAWDSVRVAGGEPREQVVEPPVAWIAGAGYRDSVPVLEPWQGYWVKNITDPPRPVVLEVPAREAPGPGKATPPQDGWRLAIRAEADGVVAGNTRLGCAATAAAGWDLHDRSEPPPSPGRAVSVYFPHGTWNVRPGNYSTDIRALSADVRGHCWSFDVAKTFRDDAGNTVDLRFDGVAGVPAEFGISLLDRDLGRAQDLRESPTYRFHLGLRDPVATESEARFVLLVGDAEYVGGQLEELAAPPLRTALHQNYPNPFNPETVIRWDVAAAGHAELKIYDLTGALVKTAHSGFVQPGGYEFVWRGEDDGGRRVASGVYIYRLRSAEVVQTHRMTLLK